MYYSFYFTEISPCFSHFKRLNLFEQLIIFYITIKARLAKPGFYLDSFNFNVVLSRIIEEVLLGKTG